MKQVNGQMDLFEKKMAPIYHVSLTHVYTVCPLCKSYNTATKLDYVGFGKERHIEEFPLERCPDCGLLFDWSPDEIEKSCVYSRDYPREV